MKSSLPKIIPAVLSAFVFLGMNSPLFAAEIDSPNITSVHPQEMRELVKLHRRADELVLKNDFRGAIKVYSDILLLEPDDEAAYTGMGQAYMILGDFDKAKDAFQNALHISPDNDTAIFGLQRIMDPDGVAGMVTASQAEGAAPPPQENLRPVQNLNPAPAAAVKTPAVPKKLRSLPWAEKENRKTPVPAKIISRPKLSVAAPMPSAGGIPGAHAVRRLRRTVPQKSFSPLSVSSVGTIPQPVSLIPPVPPIQKIQMALKDAGLYQGPIDGNINPSYKKAVRDFQLENHLAIDGKVGHRTWAALRHYLNPSDG